MNYSTTQNKIFVKNEGFYKKFERANSNIIDILFIGIVAFLCLIGFAFSVEMAVYTIYCCFAIAICFFSAKMELILYMVPFMYIVPSATNNPALTDQSIFSYTSNIIYLAGLVVIMLSLIIYRIVRDNKGKKIAVPKLTFGFVILGLSYILSGIGSGYATLANSIYGLAEIVSLCLMYFVGVLAVDWQRAQRSGFAWMGLFIGLAVVAEIICVYISKGADVLQVLYDRGTIYTGWGMYNNVGGYLIMTIPCAFYLACTERECWLYILCGAALFGGVILTTSRGALLAGSGVLVLSCVAALIAAKGKIKKLQVGISLAVIAVAGVTALIILLKDEGIEPIIDKLINLKDNGRFEIYRQGIDQFLQYPILGAGFYECDVYQFGSIEIVIQPRWHNTIVQLLATGGIVCLISYAVHRIQTVVLIVKKRTVECVFIGLCILALLVSSLVDCHMFNFGPGFLYGAYLAFAEGIPKEKRN